MGNGSGGADGFRKAIRFPPLTYIDTFRGKKWDILRQEGAGKREKSGEETGDRLDETDAVFQRNAWNVVRGSGIGDGDLVRLAGRLPSAHANHDTEFDTVMAFIIRWLVTAVALALAVWLIPGLSVQGSDWTGVALTALILGFVNAIIRPVVLLLSLPVTILTLGCFTFVINAAMLWLAAWVSNQLNPASRLVIDGWIAAIVGAIFVSVVSAVLSSLVEG